MRNTFPLLHILKTCEKFRIETEKEKKEKERENRRKELAEWVLWMPEDKKKDKTSEDEEYDIPLSVKFVKKLFTSVGGCTVLCILLFLLGGIAGLNSLATATLVRVCKDLFVLASVLIVLQSCYSVRNNLYREVNLPFYMTMPFTSVEFLLAKYLQLIGVSYGIMTIILLPLWLGYTITGGFNGCLTEAVFLGLVAIPQFVMLLQFVLVIVYYYYIRLLVPRRPVSSRLIPILSAVLLLILLLVLEFLTKGKVLGTLGKVIWEALVFNYALGLIIQGMQILPFILLVLINILSWMIFLLVGRLLYRQSILQRWDLADDRSITEVDPDKVCTEHGLLMTLYLREIRTIRGFRAYRLSNWSSSILLPFVMMILYMTMEMLFFQFFRGEESLARRLAGILVRDILPLSVLPVCMNKAVGTPFSRDAHSLEMLLIMPFNWEAELHAKVTSSLVVSIKSTTPYVLIFSFWVTAKGMIPFWGFLLAVLLNVLLLIGVVEIRTLHDIKKPLTDWKIPKEMLQKRKTPFSLLLSVIFMAISLLMGVLLGFSTMHILACFGWVYIFAFFFAVLAHLQLLISGLPCLYGLGKVEGEKTPWRKHFRKSVKEKNKVFMDFIKEKKDGDFFKLKK